MKFCPQRSFGNVWWSLSSACSFWFTLTLFSAVTQADDSGLLQSVPETWQDDAELTDVFFWNEQLGWAVGQHGIFLRTRDGGLTWQRSVTRVPLNRGQNQITSDMKNVLSQMRTQTAQGSDATSAQDYVVGNSPGIRLESVAFLNERQGWAVGGYDFPYVSLTRGVVFRTTDGGETWKPNGESLLPRLYRIQFPQAYSGWALGSFSPLLKTSLLFSGDLGQTFQSEINSPRHDLVDGDATAEGWVGIDRQGQLQRMGLTPAAAPLVTDGRTDRLRCVRMTDALTGWAVGNNGRILATSDGGKSWQRPSWLTRYPGLNKFDLACVHPRHGLVWMAGNPGSVVFCFDPQRNECQAYATGSAMPLNRVWFANASLGVAVGGMGTILRTTDGGQTWQTVRGAGQELSLLNIAFHSPDVSMEMLGRWCDEEGYLSGVAMIELASNPAPHPTVMQQATQRLGTSLYVPLPLQQLPDGTNPDLQEQLIERLVRTIRQFRPRVIVSPAAAVPLPSIGYLDCQEILDRAIRAAADRRQFPDQLTEQGLSPWQTDRLAVGSPSATGKVFELNSRQFLPRSGQLLDDRVALSRALAGVPLAGPPLQSYQLTHYSAAGLNTSNLFVGLIEIGRRLPQRPVADLRRGTLNQVQDVYQKQKQIQALLQAAAETTADLRLWRQQVGQWTMNSPRDSAGLWLVQLSEAYLQAGRLLMAEQSLDYLCQYFPEHALAPAAQWWLAQYAISSEVDIAKHSQRDAPLLAKSHLGPSGVVQVGNLENASEPPDNATELEIDAKDLAEIDKLLEADRPKIKTVPQVIENGGVKYTVWIPVEESNEGVKVAGEEVPASEAARLLADDQKLSALDANQGHERSRQRMQQLRQRYPDLAGFDGIRWLEARLLLRTGESEAALQILKQLAQGEEVDPRWRQVAWREIPESKSAREQVRWQAVPMKPRPRLDGQFDDWASPQTTLPSIWMTLPHASTPSLAANAPEKTRLESSADRIAIAYDDEFLFLAIQCQKLPRERYSHPLAARTPDADLSSYDRVEISLDSDRDGQWPLRLGIDCRGWTFDQCGVAKDWNPQWFVAKVEDELHWSVEVAIPWQHLATEPPGSGTNWQIGAARFASRQFQNLWQHPAPPALGSISTPMLLPRIPEEHFGALWFD